VPGTWYDYVLERLIYPELRHFPTARQQRRAIDVACGRRKQPVPWQRSVPASLVILGITVGLIALLGNTLFLILMIVMPALGLVNMVRGLRRRSAVRRSLRFQLAAIRICGACGYDLTDHRSGICPECGTSIGS